MLKSAIALLNGAGSQVRSSSLKHIDALFNALICLCGLVAFKAAEKVMTTISIAFQRIQGLVITDAELAIKMLKVARKSYFEYIRNPSVDPLAPEDDWDSMDDITIPDLKTVGTEARKFPILKPIIAFRIFLYAENRPSELLLFDRIVMALLSIDTVIVLPPKIDFATITTKQNTGEVTNSEILPTGEKVKEAVYTSIDSLISDQDITSALSKIGITAENFFAELKKRSASQNHMILSSAGPNGPATWTAYSDALALLSNKEVFTQWQVWVEKTGLSRFKSDLVNTVASPKHDPIDGSLLHLGKIHTFEEWGGKTRNVAIVDYWTQLALSPLHDTIFSFLRPLTTDATHDQDAACAAIRSWTKNKNSELFSFDLTAATDRLPSSFQARILSLLVPDKSISAAWVGMLNLRPYRTVDGQDLKYAVGLPMGSKSNWAMLALTHHVIIQIAAAKAGVTTPEYTLSHPGVPLENAPSDVLPSLANYSCYRVCGDDSVMHHRSVAAQYRAIMILLGLTINDTKSVIHSQDLTPAAEFCKRLFIDGHEYSSIPVKLVVKTTMNGRLSSQLQNELSKRDFNLQGSATSEWINALVDEESFGFLVILNLLPNIITGLARKIGLPITAPSLTTLLSEKRHLKDSQVAQAYTYVAAVDELKRLDGLLRATHVISEAITSKLMGYVRVDLSKVTWFKEGDVDSPFLETLQKYQTQVSYHHPIIKAAEVETARVVNLLAQLSSGSAELSNMARLRLLDSFKNAMVSSWQDPDAARAQADRSLVQKALQALAELFNLAISNAENSRLPLPILSFSTTITYLGRNWSIRWHVDENVTINTVKSKVISSATLTKESAKVRSSSIRILKALRTTVGNRPS
jgi:hypothetical protein